MNLVINVAEVKKERKAEILYCVKVKKYKNGFLKKILKKELFTKKKDAELFYDEQDVGKHIVVELSVYTDLNEKSLKTKGDK